MENEFMTSGKLMSNILQSQGNLSFEIVMYDKDGNVYLVPNTLESITISKDGIVQIFIEKYHNES